MRFLLLGVPCTLLFSTSCRADAPQPAADADPYADPGPHDTGTECERSTWYADVDGDGFGDPATGEEACDAPPDHVADGSDCDDGDAAVFPGADEDCDGRDDDCDGLVDLPLPAGAPDWYADADGDGFGAGDAHAACDAPAGFVADGTDCDDGDPGVNPAALEVCNNGLDDDCDGSAGGCGLLGSLGSADADATILGALPSQGAGTVLESSPDLTGDGVADLVVGSDADQLWVFDGTLSGTVRVGDAVVTLSGTGRIGGAVGAPGDVDGDGSADLAIGAGFDSTVGEYSGAVVVLFGPLPGEVDVQAVGTSWFGTEAGAYAGWEVVGPGDVDGDGLGDLLVAAAARESEYAADEAVYVLSGDTGEGGSLADASARLVLDWDANLCCQTSPQYLAGTGDLDGDGLADIAVGTRTDAALDPAGSLYVHLAPFAGELDLADADLLVRGEADGDSLGRSVAAGGDVDGDGTPDVLVGAYGAGEGGAAYVVGGTLRGTHVASDVAPAILGVAGDRLGLAVSNAGDLDQDGYADVAVGISGGDERPVGCVAYGPIGANLGVDDAGACLGVPGGRVWDFAGAVDLDGDGYPDLAVGNSSDDTLDADAGAAYLFRGGGR